MVGDFRIFSSFCVAAASAAEPALENYYFYYYYIINITVIPRPADSSVIIGSGAGGKVELEMSSGYLLSSECSRLRGKLAVPFLDKGPFCKFALALSKVNLLSLALLCNKKCT